ncbi:cysteine ABC transporter substrate-binding protein [Clostridium gasigenes]|uniref:Amino acid ABC transporter substrate-binding protein, PAAT family n=1 Tax=Clostridium gasigenes TaxID=94869 RepID=A0A1H0UCB2_9CLOT|nr:cysteine ABC transporter substrate-binding protein [Clostridium gasigenes]MBU3090281.1 cysteine ABC transporter substrate-binding protein [Clostridium gasigenes]MBU3131354.1 cysteine ABC transporter substrate-binding protein [Clostridium gasigenes]NKF08433.1 transporter substrate-binding domain-containing protein [Clostridium gasigenes]QSW18603.1 cysteine ABC transporter substrate-binding protein [Clostridium gasigenes]SDP63700.1 amino acid ABC transporter substrate-binding protein, PAAT fa
MKLIKKVSSLLVILTVGVGVFVGCGNKSSEKSAIDIIKERGTIKVGVFSDKPPFGYVDANGENQGYDVFIAKKLAKDLLGDESKVEFVLVEAASRVEFLQSNKVDLILANFTVTPERREVVDFANPYMKVALGIVSQDGTKVTSIDQLKGQKVIVNKGTTADAYFTKNYPDIELVKFDHNTEAFEALKDNRGAALAHDNTLLFAWARENAGYTVGISSLGEEDTIAPAVKKGNEELLQWVNAEIKSLGQNGTIREAYNETLLPAYGDTVKIEDVIIE